MVYLICSILQAISDLYLRYASCSIVEGDMTAMAFKKYILTTLRLLLNKWYLSLIKLCSLTMGMLSFLLVWLFYIDHKNAQNKSISIFNSCTSENLIILGSIILVTITVYFLIMNSQMTLRYKEFFIRKLYGESGIGIFYILFLEITIFIVVSFIFSLVLIDQVAPLFNLLTDRNVNARALGSENGFILLLSFFMIIGLIIGVLPAMKCSRTRAVDILKKLT